MDRQSERLVDLIADAKIAGFRLMVRKGKLVVRGPQSAMTPALEARLRANARALVEWKTAPPQAVHYVDLHFVDIGHTLACIDDMETGAHDNGR